MRARRAAAATIVLSTALVGMAIVLPASAQAAETAPPTGALIVNNASTTDPSAQPSACASAPYTTIQAAVNAAIAGATVYVCSGLYPEAVDIPTDLTLDGAQFGIDARTGRTNAADETIVDPIAAAGLNDFTYGTPNVLPPPASTPTTGTIDGFTISGADQPTADNTYGIVAFNDVGGGYHWVDNIITHVFYAGFIDTATSPAQSVIQHNLVEYTGEGFWEGRNYGPGADYSADNVLFDSNAFQYNGNQDIHYDGSYDLSNKATGLVASGNTSYNDAAFVLLIDTSGARVSDNTITWTGGASTAGITRFAPIGISSDNSDALISDNTITGADLTADDPYYWDEFGITVSDGYGSGAPSVGVTITHNTLSHQVFGIALRNSNTHHGDERLRRVRQHDHRLRHRERRRLHGRPGRLSRRRGRHLRAGPELLPGLHAHLDRAEPRLLDHREHRHRSAVQGHLGARHRRGGGERRRDHLRQHRHRRGRLRLPGPDRGLGHGRHG